MLLDGALDGPRIAVERELSSFLAAAMRELHELGADVLPLGCAVEQLVRAGGKRLRAACVCWGAGAAGAPWDDPSTVRVAGAVELVHALALLQDDVMDRADRRRGRPTAQHVLAGEFLGQHGANGADTAWSGVCAAVLAGNVAGVWAEDLLDRAELAPALRGRAAAVLARMRLEATAGQYLDLGLATADDASSEHALRVAVLKTARYSMTRPLQLGALVAGGTAALDGRLARYGDAVGTAFQLRDDLLDLTGRPELTGKPPSDAAGCNVVVRRALEIGDRAQRRAIAAVLVPAPDVDRRERRHTLRAAVRATGALEWAETRVGRLCARAEAALAGLPAPAEHALARLARTASYRQN